MNKVPLVSSLEIKPGRRVLVRLDTNVPVSAGRVVSAYRLQQSLPTINYLRKKGAVVMLLGHLGRPGGGPAQPYSLAPVAKWFSRVLRTPVALLDPLAKANDIKKISLLKPGQVAMLENLRFYKGETANDKNFAKRLAKLADYYVNEAFGASHRAHASVAQLPKLLPSAAGRVMVEEIKVLTKVINRPRRPLVALVGGAKMANKLPLIKSLLGYSNKVLVGGAMANTLLAARGLTVGASPVDQAMVKKLRVLVKNKKLVLPRDVMSLCHDGSCRAVPVGQTKAQDVNNDIGPATVAEFIRQLRPAKTIVWNGPLGWIEHPPFDRGTNQVARRLAKCGAFMVVGGGETVALVQKLGLIKKFSFVSTGGGAMLEFLSGNKLPGLKALGYYKK